MNKETENISEEEYLRRHIESVENKRILQNETPRRSTQDNFDVYQGSPQKNSNIQDLQYFSIDTRELPCSIFYPMGSYIQIRSARVSEIQYFSMVDDNNAYDILEKIGYILSNCVRLKTPDGQTLSYLEIKDPDKFFIIFLIRELTFQKGNTLTTKIKCPTPGEEISVELRRENFDFWQADPKIEPYYNPEGMCFSFVTINDYEFHLSPPTIGAQKSFNEWIRNKTNSSEKINESFTKIFPYLLGGTWEISQEDISNMEKDFQDDSKMDDVSFQFLNNVVSMMKFGLKGVKSFCSCGTEVRSNVIFPDGARSLFIIPDAFDRFIKK